MRISDRLSLIGLGALALMSLAGCSDQSASTEALDTAAVIEAAAPQEPPPTDTPIVAAAPQIAYRYQIGYRVAPSSIAAVQTQHKALCDRLGATRCQMVRMSNAGADEASRATLELRVDARVAAAFLADADKAVADVGGSASEREIVGEDVAKDISDTAARIAAKQALADRLMALLRERRGSVGDLVEAERAFAEAQEELDAARSWMAQLRQRVAMSTITIDYRASGPTGGSFIREIRATFDDVGEIVGGSIAVLMRVALALAPWALVLAALLWIKRRRGWVWTPRRFRRTAVPPGGDPGGA